MPVILTNSAHVDIDVSIFKCRIKHFILRLASMISIKYQTRQASREPHRPNLMDEQIIKSRRGRFDVVLSELECSNSEHSEFENIITINLSPSEYLIVEKICCSEFEQTIKGKLAEVCGK
jgi:hypothetical protein